MSTSALAIDTDILLYRSTSAAETEVDWGGDIFSLWTDLKEAKDALTQLKELKKTEKDMESRLKETTKAKEELEKERERKEDEKIK